MADKVHIFTIEIIPRGTLLIPYRQIKNCSALWSNFSIFDPPKNNKYVVWSLFPCQPSMKRALAKSHCPMLQCFFVILVMVLRTWNCCTLESLFCSYAVVLIFLSNYSRLVSFYHTTLSTCSKETSIFPFVILKSLTLHKSIFINYKDKMSWCPYLSIKEIIRFLIKWFEEHALRIQTPVELRWLLYKDGFTGFLRGEVIPEWKRSPSVVSDSMWPHGL